MNNRRRRAQHATASWRRPAAGVLLVLLLGWGGVVLLSMSLMRVVQESAVAVAGEGLARSAHALAESLSRVLYEHRLEARAIADAPVLRSGSPEAIADYLRALRVTLPAYMQVAIVDPQGNVVAGTEPVAEASPGQPRPQQNVGVDRSWRRADLVVDGFDEATHTMLFEAPIFGPDAQPLATVVMRVNLQSVVFIMNAGVRAQHAGLAELGDVEYRLLDRSGRVWIEATAHGTAVRATQVVGDRGMRSPSVGHLLESHPQRAVPVVTGYAPVPAYEAASHGHWYVTARVEREAVLAPLHRRLQPIWLGGGVLCVVVSALLLWVVRLVKKQLQAELMPRSSRPVPVTTPSVEPLRASAAGALGLRRAETPPPTAAPKPGRSLEPSTWELLKQWVRLAEVHRVALFRQHRGEDGSPWASRRYEWIGRGDLTRTEWSQWFSWSLRAKGFARWETLLSAGTLIGGPVASFPPVEAAALNSCGIKTVLVVPLFIRGEWWGFVEFDHCLRDRSWSDADVQGLRGAAVLLQAAIADAETEEALQSVLRVVDGVLESTADGMLSVDAEGRVVNFNQRLIAMWGIPDAVAESRSADEFTDWMMRQLRVPELYLRTISELQTTPDAESYDMLELLDGRLVERVSTPRWERASAAGRTWTFRELARSSTRLHAITPRREERAS